MGKVFIISAPSGTGKTTVAKKVLSQLPDLVRVVTYTTRPPRPGEVDGQDYRFISKEDFEKKIKENYFLEYANVYGNYYGTPKKDIEDILSQGKDALLIIDVQGAFKVKSLMPEAVSIFLLPPSFEELKRRIEGRGYVDKNLEKRLQTAKEEIPCARYFDYIVINDFLNNAVEKVKAIILSYRVETSRVLNNIEKYLQGSDIVDLVKGGKCYVKET
ncbi:guanylate kinase [Aquifex sp.]